MAGSFYQPRPSYSQIIIPFEDVLLVLLVFFDISHGLEDRKIGTHYSLHLLSTSLAKVNHPTYEIIHLLYQRPLFFATTLCKNNH